MDLHNLRRKAPWNETVRHQHLYQEQFEERMFYVTTIGPAIVVEFLDGGEGRVRRDVFEKSLWTGVVTHSAQCPKCD